MAGMVPYSDYEKALRRAWPFGAFDDFFAPLAAISADDAFKMNVEDAGDKYVVTAELPGVKKDEVGVELNEGRLSISVDKKESDEGRTRTTCRRRPRVVAGKSWRVPEGCRDGWTHRKDGRRRPYRQCPQAGREVQRHEGRNRLAA